VQTTPVEADVQAAHPGSQGTNLPPFFAADTPSPKEVHFPSSRVKLLAHWVQTVADEQTSQLEEQEKHSEPDGKDPLEQAVQTEADAQAVHFESAQRIQAPPERKRPSPQAQAPLMREAPLGQVGGRHELSLGINPGAQI
jgi:hypothetical protein